MNVKGTAAGGGNSLLIPMAEFSMGLIGDINDVTNAHNLALVALTARMQHERNYTDEQLARLSHMRRLDIDPTRAQAAFEALGEPGRERLDLQDRITLRLAARRGRLLEALQDNPDWNTDLLRNEAIALKAAGDLYIPPKDLCWIGPMNLCVSAC